MAGTGPVSVNDCTKSADLNKRDSPHNRLCQLVSDSKDYLNQALSPGRIDIKEDYALWLVVSTGCNTSSKQEVAQTKAHTEVDAKVTRLVLETIGNDAHNTRIKSLS